MKAKVTLRKAPEEVRLLVKRMLRDDFPKLSKVNVTINTLMAFCEEGAAVKLHGVPCAATIKINSPQDRIEGKRDATIKLDAAVWDEKSERQREALIWHELNHLIVDRNKLGKLKKDIAGRPKLKNKLDDYEINGFFSCLQRYTVDSPEWQSFLKVLAKYQELGLLRTIKVA